MQRRPRDEDFYVRVAIETHRPGMFRQQAGSLAMFLGKDFGDWGEL